MALYATQLLISRILSCGMKSLCEEFGYVLKQLAFYWGTLSVAIDAFLRVRFSYRLSLMNY